MDDRERNEIEGAITLLFPLADSDHYCDDETCTIEHPACQHMQALSARKKLDDLLDPKITTLHPNRLSNPAERIYFEEAAKWMDRSPGLNSGFSTLEHILDPGVNDRSGTPGFHRPAPPRPTQRDAEVAGTLMQWLGTNCGQGFMMTCERRIKEERAERSAWSMEYSGTGTGVGVSSWEIETADKVVLACLPPSKGRPYAVSRVAWMIRQLLAVVAVQSGRSNTRDAAARLQMSADQFVAMMDRVVVHAREFADECKGKGAGQ